MKILLSCHSADYGGIQTWLVNLARKYRALGRTCEAFFFQEGTYEPHIPADLPYHVGDLTAYLTLVRDRRFDIVHACNLDWELGISAVRWLGPKLILTCHGWVCPSWNSTNCDALVACSRWNADGQRAASAVAVRVVNYGIDTGLFSPRTTDARVSGPPIVAWVGRGSALEQKRIDQLAAIASHLGRGEVRLWLADPEGPNQVIPAIAEALRPLAEFWGPVPHDRMADFFRDVAQSGGCLLTTSSFEGLPISLLEAQACGCPVIGPDVRGVNEAIDPSHGGVIYPPDLPAEQVARLILDTLRDEEGMATRRQKCRGYAVKRFDHGRMVKEYLDVYEQALTTPRRLELWPSAGVYRSLVRFRNPDYIATNWGAAHAQFRASERLRHAGDVKSAKAVALSSLQTCPTLFLRPRRLRHLISSCWGSHRSDGPQPSLNSPATR